MKISEKNKDKRKKILQAGLYLFWKFWFKKISIDQIVERAWIAKWTFYLYFKNKESLYEDIVLKCISGWQEKMKELFLKIPDPAERIFVKMIKSIIFLKRNNLILNLTIWNENYFSQKITPSFLNKIHYKMISILISKEEIEKLWFSFEDILISFDIFSYSVFLEKYTKTEEEFLEKIKKIWEILIKWLFSKSNFSWKEIFKKNKEILEKRISLKNFFTK